MGPSVTSNAQRVISETSAEPKWGEYSDLRHCFRSGDAGYHRLSDRCNKGFYTGYLQARL